MDAAPHPLEAGPDGWRYWRAEADGLIELGALRGSAPGLAPHFHEQVQITLVLAGRRALRVAGQTIELAAGRCLCIPAGVPHGSLAEPPDVVGLIAFVAPGPYAFDALEVAIERSWVPESRTSLAELGALAMRHRRDATTGAASETRARLPDAPIERLAAGDGLSREAFTRRFARARGMPPHAYRLAARLDRARRLLCEGAGIAEVAAETGFADQSHLGRAFKRAFGVSPGRYRRG